MVRVAIVIAVVIVLGGVSVGLLGGLAKLLVARELLILIKYNTVFWITIVIVCGFAAYNKIRYPERFVWPEVVIQLIFSALIVFFSYCLFFSTSSNISDKEIWNGYVSKVTYEESWTEEYDCSYTTTDSKGNTTYHQQTCERHVPPSSSSFIFLIYLYLFKHLYILPAHRRGLLALL